MTYERPEFRFDYPDEWEMSEQWAGDDLTVTLTDGGTTIWCATLLSGHPDPRVVVTEAVQAFREEYTDIDVSESEVVFAGQQAAAAEVNFVCFELLNTATLQAFTVGRCTVLLMSQATDADLGIAQPVFEKINGSIVVASALP